MPDLKNPTKPFDQPDKIEPGSGTVPEVPEMFAPGEMAPAEGMRAQYGYRNERLPKHYQDILRNLCQKIAERDLFARIDEILRAAEQRFYWRSMFDVYFNEQNYVWELPGMMPWKTEDSGNDRLSYAFNIYQAYGRGFISQVGHAPNVRFQAADITAASGMRVASGANCLKAKIESQNDPGQLAKEVARLMWTDGRVCLYSRWVVDGSKFGYEDEAIRQEVPEGLGQGGEPPAKTPRRPRGGEKIDAYGVLECRVPITMRKRSDFPFIQLAYEIDLTTAKSMYPHISDSISGSTPGPGEYEFDTVTRVAINQGLRLLTQTGDTVHQIPTWQRTWMRPAFYAEIEDDNDRLFFERNFPDGVMVAFVGDTYAESRNESMDDHWQIIYPIEGDGQQTPSCGYQLMAVQDAVCDMTDLYMETAMKAIPAIYGDKGLIDFAALSKQKAGPGAHWPTKRELHENEDLNKKIFAEPQVEMNASSMDFYKMLWGDVPQFLTGQFPAVMGASDPSNQTKGGILALADASRGFQGPAWRSWQSGYSGSLEQLVRIGAYFRAAESVDGKLKLDIPGGQATEIDIEDLRPGSYFAMPDSDQNLPQTFEEQQLSFQFLWNSALQGFAPAAQTIMLPKNRLLAKKFLGIPGIAIPGADAAEKQMAEIEQMLQEAPVPNVEAQALRMAVSVGAQVAGVAPPPPPPPDALYNPSVPIDPETDDNQNEAQAGLDWINSPEGQQAKSENPQGFMNVKLHVLAHKKAASAAQDASAASMVKQAGALEFAKSKGKNMGESKPPSLSINYKDLGPFGRVQAGRKAGLDTSADQVVAAATPPPPPQPPPNQA